MTRRADPDSRPRPGPAADPGRVAWFHCFAGIAGDMALGALVDAGASLDGVLEMIGTIPVGGYDVRAEPVLRGGIAATRVVVDAVDDVVVRTFPHIVGMVHEARLAPRVEARALAVFEALARVESALHRRPIDQVHFHEVGGLDSIVDVIGVCAALELLDVDTVAASPVANGSGIVRSAHGVLPNPPPAVVALLEGIPTYGRDIPVELTTPTGAAILAALASGFGPLPAMTVEVSGFGAGTRELDELPNATQVVVGRPTSDRAAGEGASGQPVWLLETNVDDVTGEQLATAIADVLSAGAHDAWLTPVIMKKGRPGHVLSAVCDLTAAGAVRDTIRRATGSLGIRGRLVDRWPSARREGSVDVPGGPVRVKSGPYRAKAEHDDVVRASQRSGSSVWEIERAVQRGTAGGADEPGSGERNGPGVARSGPPDEIA